MIVLIAPADMRGFLGAPSSLLVLEGVAETAPLALPGLALWRVRQVAGGLLVHEGTAPEGQPVALPAAPAGLLGVVAPDAAAAAPLLAAWRDLAPEPPPVIEARDGAAALPGVARLVLAGLHAQAAQAAQLHRSLVATRADYEETRVAILALQQSVGHLPPPAPMQRLAGEPAPEGLAVAASGGRLLLGQSLGLQAAGLCTLALHLARAEVAPGGWLGIRLYGGESGRVLGAWRVPGEVLAPGWLTLDLPAPVGPLRETACLDIAGDLGPQDALDLALEDAPAPPERAVLVREGWAGAADRALAVRLWTAPLGRRYAQALHWDAEQLDLPLSPAGVPVAMPAQVWEAAEYSAGGRAVGFGSGPPRPMAVLNGGEQVLLRLPLVPVTGLDLLEAEVLLRQGEATGLEAGLWLQPVDRDPPGWEHRGRESPPRTMPAHERPGEGQGAHGPGDGPLEEAAMRLDAPGARWSGWRGFDAASGRLGISLVLPLDRPPLLAAVLVVRNTAPPVSEAARVEWAELTGRRMAQLALTPPPQRRAAATVLRTELRGVRLQELWRSEDGGYQHLDLWLDGMRAGGLAWPLLRCKFAINGGVPQLEFRIRPDWPQVFDLWPGEKADEHGPVYVLAEDRVAETLAEMRNSRDRRMLEALLRALPAVVGTVAHQASSDPKDHETWVAMARRLSATAEPALTVG